MMAGRKLLVALLCPLVVVGGVILIQGCGGGGQTEETQTATEEEMPAAEEPVPDESMPEPSATPEHEAVMALAGYTCPMHPEATSLEPGQCGACGMDLEEAQVLYVCTMCNEVHSREPGRCSHCDVDLVLRPVPED